MNRQVRRSPLHVSLLLCSCNHTVGDSDYLRDTCLSHPDGRRLGFREYGASDGQCILNSHGTPGCRFEGQLLDSTASRMGVSLIAVDRPGMGLSIASRFNQLTFAVDVKTLICHRRSRSSWPRIGILAISGGTSYALACVQLLSDDVSAVGILSLGSPFSPDDPSPHWTGNSEPPINSRDLLACFFTDSFDLQNGIHRRLLRGYSRTFH